MKVYRLIWTAAVAVLVARGLMLGIGYDADLTAVVFLLGAGIGATWAMLAHRADGSRRTGPTAVGVAAGVAGAAGAVSAALVGHAVTLGAGLILIVLMAVATAPGVLTARDRWTSVPSRTARALDALSRELANMAPGYLPATSRASQLTDEQLWDEWRHTEAALHRLPRSTPPSHVLELVDHRQAYLEELERRDPELVAALLPSGAAADWDDASRRLGS